MTKIEVSKKENKVQNIIPYKINKSKNKWNWFVYPKTTQESVNMKGKFH